MPANRPAHPAKISVLRMAYNNQSAAVDIPESYTRLLVSFLLFETLPQTGNIFLRQTIAVI